MSKNLPELRLRPFQDDCGFGHLGRFGDTGRVKKLLRFDPPNIVRHGGVSGFEEVRKKEKKKHRDRHPHHIRRQR